MNLISFSCLELIVLKDEKSTEKFLKHCFKTSHDEKLEYTWEWVFAF